MMAVGEVEVLTGKLRAAGVDVAKVRDDLLGIVAAAEGAARRASVAAGPDKFGSRFRDGEQGFDNTMTGISEGGRSAAASFKEMSQGLHDAAGVLDRVEQVSAEDFDRLT